MRRGVLGISQGAASAFALAATAFIIAVALAAQTPNLFTIQRVGLEQAGEAEKLAGVRLSLVAVLEDGTAIIANDGSTPVTIDKLYTSSGVISLTSPITIQPGQKVSVIVNSPDVLAVGLPDGGRKVILKEKPGVEIATITSSTNPTSTTRITTSHRTTTTTYTTTFTTTVTTTAVPTYTQRTTIYSTQYTPFVVTATHASLYTVLIRTATVTTEWWTWCNNYCSRTYVYTYSPTYTYTPGTGVLRTITATATATATARVVTSTTTSLDTQLVPPTLWFVTYIISTLPSVTTTTTTTAATVTIYTYSGTYFFTTTNYYSYYTYRPVRTLGTTTYTTATVTVTNTAVTTTTVS